MTTQLFDLLVSRGLGRGSIVQSLAGHDRLRPYVVMRAEGCFIWLADGVTRKMESPKKKRVRHVRPLGAVGSLDDLDRIEALGDAGQRNKALRRLLDTTLGTRDPEDDRTDNDKEES
jgi:hypothetical protein